MRLVGASFAGRAINADDGFFDDILRKATALLTAKGLPPDEADEQRDRLLAGFRWILVDEYQDIGAEQYALISALAGRAQRGRWTGSAYSRWATMTRTSTPSPAHRSSSSAVSKSDYKARPSYLIENYRSTAAHHRRPPTG